MLVDDNVKLIFAREIGMEINKFWSEEPTLEKVNNSYLFIFLFVSFLELEGILANNQQCQVRMNDDNNKDEMWNTMENEIT